MGTKNIFFYGSIITSIIVIIVLIVIIKKHYYSSKPEDFQISLGMIANQRKFYGKYTNDCSRKLVGDSAPGQFKWNCINACQEEAIRRGKMNIPDLSDVEYQRHNQCSTRYSTSNDIDKCDCMNERLEWCKEQYCSFNKGDNSTCISDCLRTRAINCNNLSSGGLPL